MNARLYRMIAQAVASAREECEQQSADAALVQVAENLADVFAEESDKFDRERFLLTAGAA
jgi:hypothetical protein